MVWVRYNLSLPPAGDLGGIPTFGLSIPGTSMGMERAYSILLYRHHRFECDCVWVQLDKLYCPRDGGFTVCQLIDPGRLELTDRYGLPYHGQSGLQTGFLVAFTQLIPEHQIQVFGVVKMRVKVRDGLGSRFGNDLPDPYQIKDER
jgi:hypothetical protein